MEPDLTPLTIREERRLERAEDAVAHIPVLQVEVQNVKEEVRGLKRAIWSACGSILVATFVFLLSIAAGWIP